MECTAPKPGQEAQTDHGEAGLRAEYATGWIIGCTTEKWHAVRRDLRPGLRDLSATTARALLADLARVEEATR